VGGGIEYALTNNWSLKGEYLYADFGTADFEFPGATAGVTLTRSGVPGTSTIVNGRTASNDLDLHSVKLGINYRF
jgi:hemoglobin/transferrin/lactoferrin receptor protein